MVSLAHLSTAANSIHFRSTLLVWEMSKMLPLGDNKKQSVGMPMRLGSSGKGLGRVCRRFQVQPFTTIP